MKTKNLYVIVKNCCDGSFHTTYTFNEQWVLDLESRIDSGEATEYEMEVYCDGDGFHYDILTVPEECTLASLGITYDVASR
jgi:hypothetical protein